MQPTSFCKSTWFRVTLGTLISALFLFLALKDVPLDIVADALAHANYGLVAIAVGAMLLQSWLRAVRWVQLYYPLHKGLRPRQMFRIVLVMQMLNILAPWRLGDLARIYLAGEIEKRSKVQTIATLGTEKIFDTLMLVALLLGIPLFMTLPPSLEETRVGLMILLVGMLAAVLALLLARDSLLGLLKGIPIPWLRRYVDQHAELALASLEVFRRWDIHLGLQALSLAMWTLGVLVNYLALLALNLQLPAITSFVVLAIMTVGGYVPSSPGKIGVFQALCILALSLFGVDKTIGLTYGILLYLISQGTPIVAGIAVVWWGGINLRRVSAEGA
jgi:uncharacterized protein (TIRG00374 family)